MLRAYVTATVTPHPPSVRQPSIRSNSCRLLFLLLLQADRLVVRSQTVVIVGEQPDGWVPIVTAAVLTVQRSYRGRAWLFPVWYHREGRERNVSSHVAARSSVDTPRASRRSPCFTASPCLCNHHHRPCPRPLQATPGSTPPWHSCGETAGCTTWRGTRVGAASVVKKKCSGHHSPYYCHRFTPLLPLCIVIIFCDHLPPSVCMLHVPQYPHCCAAVACFLTRGDLYQSWEAGARIFDKYLLDSDWALNNGACCMCLEWLLAELDCCSALVSLCSDPAPASPHLAPVLTTLHHMRTHAHCRQLAVAVRVRLLLPVLPRVQPRRVSQEDRPQWLVVVVAAALERLRWAARLTEPGTTCVLAR